MRMQIDRKGGSLFQRGNQIICLERTKKSGHILDADGVSTHLLDLACNVLPVLQSIRIAQCINQRDLCVCAGFLGCLYSRLQIAKVIQAVKNTDTVDTVFNRLLYEAVNNIIRIVRISEDILAAKQHLGRSVLEVALQNTKSLPRILVKETKAGIEGSAAPALYCSIANLVHRINDGKHLFNGHSGCDQ